MEKMGTGTSTEIPVRFGTRYQMLIPKHDYSTWFLKGFKRTILCIASTLLPNPIFPTFLPSFSCNFSVITNGSK
ncbi:hypothetical protein Hanom_Chr00s000001g01595661 [Helianthus anomalus]